MKEIVNVFFLVGGGQRVQDSGIGQGEEGASYSRTFFPADSRVLQRWQRYREPRFRPEIRPEST